MALELIDDFTPCHLPGCRATDHLCSKCRLNAILLQGARVDLESMTERKREATRRALVAEAMLEVEKAKRLDDFGLLTQRLESVGRWRAMALSLAKDLDTCSGT